MSKGLDGQSRDVTQVTPSGQWKMVNGGETRNLFSCAPAKGPEVVRRLHNESNRQACCRKHRLYGGIPMLSREHVHILATTQKLSV